MGEGVLTGDITSHTHSYLPLSGGTLYKSNNNTPLVIKGIKAGAWIAYKDSDSEFLGSIGVQSDKKAYFYETSLGAAELLHSGNYNSYAPTLTGTGASGTWGISISGNAATTTKLATPRTIWGQRFDGSANVWSGIDIDGYKDVNSVTKVADLGTIGLVINASTIRKNWGMCFWTEGNGRGMIQQQAFTSNATTYPICLQPFGGNVLIGTTTDNGYKLQVNGSERVYGDLIVDGEVSALVA